MKPFIHQYTPDITQGDGVSNSLFFIQKILNGMGYESNIYADIIQPELADRVHPRKDYCDQGDNLLFCHHSVANPDPDWFANLKDRMVMIYHNITPSHYFAQGTPHHHATQEGRQQLKDWQNLFAATIADSRYNYMELAGFGYPNIHEIPLLIDFEKLNAIIADEQILRKHEDNFNLLFVGRIAENKCQHDLIHALAQLKDKNVHLFCVGGISSPTYQHFLEKLASSYGLQDQVHLTGRVSDEVLWGYYLNADLFVCLSDHEGFGIPLIESAYAGLPVVAYDSSNIRHTLGGTGLLLPGKNSHDVAGAWQKLMDQPEWRHELARSQKANLARFSRETITQKLTDLLASVIPALPGKPGKPGKPNLRLKEKTILPPENKPLKISIEGPFDSNYSLALVNRELALALAREGLQIELHSTEGGGDYPPDQKFLVDYPSIQNLWNNGTRDKKADIAFRNLYPPRVSGMNGDQKVLGPYGWEESAFPLEWVEAFNLRLDLVTTMSDYVTRTLENNGVKSPVLTIGIGADHSKNIPPEPLPFEFPTGYTLLHISSCFPRKGVDLLLSAFVSAYGPETYATLIIKTFPNPWNDIRIQLDRAGWKKVSPFLFGQDQTNQKILLIEQEFSPGQIISLYQQSDLLVAPSKGEGFGLPMAEAMLFDLPVLTTGFGGQVDFCSNDTAWLIDYRFARATTHLNLAASVWAEPDLNDLIHKLKEIKALPLEKIQTKTNLAKANILAHHTWEQVAKRLIKAISPDLKNGIKSFPKPSPRIGWVTTWNTRCGIASYSSHLINTLGHHRLTILAAGTNAPTKKDGHNVIRCWKAGENDDLSDLLHRIIAGKITDLVIQFNFSFFNLQALSQFLGEMDSRKIRCFIFFHSTADVLPPHEPKSLSTIKNALSRAHRLLVHATHDLNFFKKIGLVENVMLFPHGVRPMGKLQTTAPELIPGSIPERIIATCGFLLPHKGIGELIEAFEILRTREPNLKLLLLNALHPGKSSGIELDKCLEKIRQSPHGEDITLVNDYLTEEKMLETLSRAQLIVYPCQESQESSSASVRMGIATGRPVAVTPLAIFEDVADAVYTLPGTTPEQMALGIKPLITENFIGSLPRQKNWLDSHDWKTIGKRLKLILNNR